MSKRQRKRWGKSKQEIGEEGGANEKVAEKEKEKGSRKIFFLKKNGCSSNKARLKVKD